MFERVFVWFCLQWFGAFSVYFEQGQAVAISGSFGHSYEVCFIIYIISLGVAWVAGFFKHRYATV